jgi:hypothetical protein
MFFVQEAANRSFTLSAQQILSDVWLLKTPTRLLQAMSDLPSSAIEAIANNKLTLTVSISASRYIPLSPGYSQ